MTLWKLTLSYDGTDFCGWQVQPGLPTIQGSLAQAIEHVTGEHVLPQGSGRTDTGVHAFAQIASFALAAPVPAASLQRALNRVLPPSIRVLEAASMPPGFHARHSALRKTYEYRIFPRSSGDSPNDSPMETVCSPFDARFMWDCHWPLQIAPMQRAAMLLCGTHDFTSFAATDPDLAQRNNDAARPAPMKTIYESTVEGKGALLLYRVTGSGFLHHMVRNIVGTLAEIGRGRLEPESIHRILAAKDRSAAGPTAPPQGLFLFEVIYPDCADCASTAPGFAPGLAPGLAQGFAQGFAQSGPREPGQ
jgi:tRNA pseudouridine38-40 synthase